MIDNCRQSDSCSTKQSKNASHETDKRANYSSSSSGISKSECQSDFRSNRFNMDELSIDSTTNQMIQVRKANKEHPSRNAEFQQVIMNPDYNVSPPLAANETPSKKRAPASEKSHFRIDWRQLTYYQKPESLISKLINGTISSAEKKSDSKQNIVSAMKKNSASGPKRILNSLDGCFRSGQLSAILGPSGAGKTTFLSTLFGSKQETAFGQTKVTWFTDDGLPTKEGQRSIKIAFLPQHDHLLNHLTVFETLMFASKIKNATTKSTKGESFHRSNVKRVAKMLKITECLDTRCGKLSGGQYKRVSIGQELLSEPDVIILDEPTSGLDAMTCLTTINTLKSIATKHPISIILTIHQPDIDVFNQFDHVYVIAQGGIAIYEGKPENIVPTLESVGLHMPLANYNPARFIVENAFIVEPEPGNQQPDCHASARVDCVSPDSSLDDSSDSGHSEDEEDLMSKKESNKGYLKRSLVSLTEAISGKEMSSGMESSKRDKRPLLNIGIQTFDGKLITDKQLAEQKRNKFESNVELQRWNLINRLNQIQRAPYLGDQRLDVNSPSDSFDSDMLSTQRTPFSSGRQSKNEHLTMGSRLASPNLGEQEDEQEQRRQDNLTVAEKTDKLSTDRSDYSSLFWSDKRGDIKGSGGNLRETSRDARANSLAFLNQHDGDHPMAQVEPANLNLNDRKRTLGRSLPMFHDQVPSGDRGTLNSTGSSETEETEFVVSFDGVHSDQGKQLNTTTMSPTSSNGTKLKRKFDKRLSAKHNCSKQNYPIWYHSMLLTHRTWLSIIRDPIFFGIQACMHTTIPILLALIFGSTQEEGCPRIGGFDLVDFAYSDSDNMIQGTVSSIRKSIGNIGIIFFEMFVLSFSINCITALVFPLDMYVLLKEYRNGWYSLRSYFFGRTLADLPVPILLHSLGMSILYYLTGQPGELWRFVSVVGVVIIASLIAQSVGLTVGAILMRSSQSAVLTAAGIVAPFFALSGFIVRIHTLPLLARIAASSSYLYHLINSFIILRYGFGRCLCKPEDFEPNEAHQIPNNLHTLASMWIGTYSNEYPDATVLQQQQVAVGNATGMAIAASNRTNVDPNIDVVDKMMNAFKMANSYGHQIHDCGDVIPYAMLDFNLRDSDMYYSVLALIVMLIVSRFITFSAIYYKIRSFA